MLFLPGPDKLRIKMRVIVEFFARFYGRDRLNVVVNFVRRQRRIGLWCNETHGRVVDTLLSGVLVPLDGPLLRVCSPLLVLPSRHPALPLGYSVFWYRAIVIAPLDNDQTLVRRSS